MEMGIIKMGIMKMGIMKMGIMKMGSFKAYCGDIVAKNDAIFRFPK